MLISSIDILDALKTRAGHMACHTVFYDWSLRGQTPDRLIVRPVDPWRGDAAKAQDLLNAAGVQERTGPQWQTDWWSPEDADELWISHMHGFGWLRDLRTLGTPHAREQGRLMIENWLSAYGSWNAQNWRPDITGRRLAMWICHYDFFCGGHDEAFEDQFLSSIVKQAKHLSNTFSMTKGANRMESLKGLLYAGIALEGYEKWIDQSLKCLEQAIDEQILADGGHVSRSPATMLEILEILVDIRSALTAGAYPVPDHIASTIDSVSAALRLFRYRDRKFGVFNGTQEGDIETIDSILAQAGTHTKAKTSLPDTGFERLECGRSLIVIDTGRAPPAPYDKTAHAGALGFELSYGKERIFVSCGTHPANEDWREALRFTAAHNTGCIDYRNSCEIKKDGYFGRKVTKTTCEREQTRDAVLLDASHNGYVALNGITHERKIYMADEGHDIRGEDDFTSTLELMKPVETAIRFHIHPNVKASLVNDGQEVLLRMPGGMGWRFKHSTGVLKLEDSLYLGEGITHRKTQQIVIYGRMSEGDACVKWSLKREG